MTQAIDDQDADLTPEQKRAILAQHGLTVGDDAKFLDVPPGADRRAVRRARDRIVKDFHPDRTKYLDKLCVAKIRSPQNR